MDKAKNCLSKQTCFFYHHHHVLKELILDYLICFFFADQGCMIGAPCPKSKSPSRPKISSDQTMFSQKVFFHGVHYSLKGFFCFLSRFVFHQTELLNHKFNFLLQNLMDLKKFESNNILEPKMWV